MATAAPPSASLPPSRAFSASRTFADAVVPQRPMPAARTSWHDRPMRTITLLFAAILFSSQSPVFAETGRYPALKALTQALPESNPGAKSGFLEENGGSLPGEMCACRFEPSEMEAVERLVALIDEYLGSGGRGKGALLEQIRKEFTDTGKMSQWDYSQLSLGVRFAPGTTRLRLVKAGCRSLLRQYFAWGANRDELLAAVEQHRARLDLSPASK